MAQAPPPDILSTAGQIATGLVVTIFAIHRVITFIIGTRKKTDTGEQRKIFFNLLEQAQNTARELEADNLRLEADKRELEADRQELEHANAAAQVTIADLRAKLKDCGCE